GSLVNGTYQLTVRGDVTYNGFGLLDGDGDGTPGGDKVVNLHRLFGDIDGDKDVDLDDLFVLGGALFGIQGQPGPPTYLAGFDFDADGDVDLDDLFAFGPRLFTVYP